MAPPRPLLYLVLLAIAACAARSPVSDAITDRVVDGGMIDIAALTKFDWDTLYVFSPYTPIGVVCDKLGAQLEDCRTKIPSPGIDESSYLLAFAKGGKIVHHEMYLRGKADFCQTSCTLEVPKDRAVFKVARVATPSGWSQQFYLTASAA
jgi:hypothetical protein